jgi:hypothetical protein
LHEDRKAAVEALKLKYITGVISEVVFEASLRAHVNADEARFLIHLNQECHRRSMPYRRGDV